MHEGCVRVTEQNNICHNVIDIGSMNEEAVGNKRYNFKGASEAGRTRDVGL